LVWFPPQFEIFHALGTFDLAQCGDLAYSGFINGVEIPDPLFPDITFDADLVKFTINSEDRSLIGNYTYEVRAVYACLDNSPLFVY
jgi:hypothetical protein